MKSKTTAKSTAKRSARKTTKAKKGTTTRKKATARLSEHELRTLIEQKAYEFYKMRGESHQNDWDDWFRAERFVREGKC